MIKLFRTPIRMDAELEFTVSGEVLIINGEVFDLSGVGVEPEMVNSPFVPIPVFRTGDQVNVQLVAPYGAEDDPVDHEPLPPVELPTPVSIAQPRLFATAGLTIAGGLATSIELASQIASVYYEEGWLSVAFSDPLDSTNYLVFAQTDVLAKIEQFKDLGSFELILTDPATGDPLEPGRIDLQLLKVTG